MYRRQIPGRSHTVFITLKEFAEEKGQQGVMEFCDRLVGMGAIELFRQGRALVLLDGLDEVREENAGRVLRQIQQFSVQFSVQFPGNQFVITCRIAAREYTFEQFTEVEVADFSPEQVAELVDMEVESGAVLKAIDAQHGLFVERARQIYSFSHLTFQEYFAARGIVEARDSAALQALATHINEKRWREVCLRVTEMLPSTDEWLRMVKAETDSRLAKDEKLRAFLRGVDEKAQAVNVPYKSAAVRALYFARSRDRNCDRDRNLYHDSDLARALAYDLDHALALYRAIDRAIDPESQSKLEKLRDQLPDDSLSRSNLDQWWETNGEAWTAELRTVMTEYRNIGQDWQFTKEQKYRLQQYYDAHKLPGACLLGGFPHRLHTYILALLH